VDRAWIRRGDTLRWTQQLIAFQMLPRDWPARSAFPSSPELAAFRHFYELADSRSGALAANLLRAGPWRNAALVVGGFHSERIARLLNAAHCTVLIASPVLKRSPTDFAPSSYLRSFDQSADPFERLFLASRQSLSDNRRVGIGASAVWSTAAMLAAIAVRIADIRGLSRQRFAAAGVEVQRLPGTTGYRAGVMIQGFKCWVRVNTTLRAAPSPGVRLQIGSVKFSADTDMHLSLLAFIASVVSLTAFVHTASPALFANGFGGAFVPVLAWVYGVFHPMWIGVFLIVALYFLVLEPFQGRSDNLSKWRNLADIVFPLLPILGGISTGFMGGGISEDKQIYYGMLGISLGTVTLAGARLIGSRGKMPSLHRLLLDLIINQPVIILALGEFFPVFDQYRGELMVMGSLIIGLLSVTLLPRDRWQQIQRSLKITIRPRSARFLLVSLPYMDWLTKILLVPYTPSLSIFHQGEHSAWWLSVYLSVWVGTIGVSYLVRIPLGLVLFITGYLGNAIEKILWRGAIDPLIFMGSTANMADFFQWIGIGLITMSIFIFVTRWRPWHDRRHSESRVIALLNEERLTPGSSQLLVSHIVFWAIAFSIMGMSLYQGRSLLSQHNRILTRAVNLLANVDDNEMKRLRNDLERAAGTDRHVIDLNVSVDLTDDIRARIKELEQIVADRGVSSYKLLPLVFGPAFPGSQQYQLQIDNVRVRPRPAETMIQAMTRTLTDTIYVIGDSNGRLSVSKLVSIRSRLSEIAAVIEADEGSVRMAQAAWFERQSRRMSAYIDSIERQKRLGERLPLDEEKIIEDYATRMERGFAALSEKATQWDGPWPEDETTAGRMFQMFLRETGLPLATDGAKPAPLSSPRRYSESA
jgi:hypothetical protein